MLTLEFNRNPVVDDEAAFDILPPYGCFLGALLEKRANSDIQSSPSRPSLSATSTANSDNNGSR